MSQTSRNPPELAQIDTRLFALLSHDIAEGDDIEQILARGSFITDAPSDVLSEPVSSIYCPTPTEYFPQFKNFNRDSLDSNAAAPIDTTNYVIKQAIGETPKGILKKKTSFPDVSIQDDETTKDTTPTLTNFPQKEVSDDDSSITTTFEVSYQQEVYRGERSDGRSLYETLGAGNVHETAAASASTVFYQAHGSPSMMPPPLPPKKSYSPVSTIHPEFPQPPNTYSLSRYDSYNQSNGRLSRSASEPARYIDNSLLNSRISTESPSEISSSSDPYFAGYLYKLGRHGRWNWRLFRFDGLSITCWRDSGVLDSPELKWTIKLTDVSQIALLRKPPDANSTESPSLLRKFLRQAAAGIGTNATFDASDVKNSDMTILATTEGRGGLSTVGYEVAKYGSLPSYLNDGSTDGTNWGMCSGKSVFGVGGNYVNKCFVIRTKESRNYIFRAKENDDLERWVWLLVRMWEIHQTQARTEQQNLTAEKILPQVPESPTIMPIKSDPDFLSNNTADLASRDERPQIQVPAPGAQRQTVSVKSYDGRLIEVPGRQLSLFRNGPNSALPTPLNVNYAPTAKTIQEDESDNDEEEEEEIENIRRTQRPTSVVSYLSDDALSDMMSDPSIPRSSVRMSISLSTTISSDKERFERKHASILLDPLLNVNSGASPPLAQKTSTTPRVRPRRNNSNDSTIKSLESSQLGHNDSNYSSIKSSEGSQLYEQESPKQQQKPVPLPANKPLDQKSTSVVFWSTLPPPPAPTYLPPPPPFSRPQHHLQIQPKESLKRIQTLPSPLPKSPQKYDDEEKALKIAKKEFRKSLGELLALDQNVHIDVDLSLKVGNSIRKTDSEKRRNKSFDEMYKSNLPLPELPR